jgi:Ca2+-binding EF-hand superfamily protein
MPSPSYKNKVESYWNSIGDERTKLAESGAHTMPNGKGVFWNKPELNSHIFEYKLAHDLSADDDPGSSLLATQTSLHESLSSSSFGSPARGRRAGLNKHHKVMQLPSLLDKEEEHLAKVLTNLLPSTQKELARVGSSCGRDSKAQEAKPSPSMGHGKLDEQPQPTIYRLTSTRQITPEASQESSLKMRSDDTWQPTLMATKSQQLDTAMKLVQGGKGAAQREWGGGLTRIVADAEVKTAKSSYRATQKSAASTTYLLHAMDGTDPPKQQQLHEHPKQEAASPLARSPSKKRTVSNGAMKAELQGTFSLRDFRDRLLQRYSSVSEAFNSVDVDSDRQLSLKEWVLVLKNSGLATYREARSLFELMDANKDGHLTMLEFHVGVESIAPVLSLESLRKRLLCLGCTSMTQALAMMNGPGDDISSRPLSFLEFADALKRIYVPEPAEHRAIFEAARTEPGPRTPESRVSIADLACALSAVSPSLLLEELRCRLIKRFGCLRDAWTALTQKKELNLDTFRKQAIDRLQLTSMEAEKAFNFIDIDNSREISRAEFLGALNVSTASILLEDTRHKVRGRYLSIDAAFRDAFDNLGDQEIDNDTSLDVEEFADILEKVEIGRRDTLRLFELIDGDREGRLTLMEFFKGIRLFAPSCTMEGMRLQLLQSSFNIAEVICNVVDDSRMPLNRSTFFKLLELLNVECDDNPELIFDFLDVRNVGIVTVSEVIAAIQNLAGGTRKMENPSVREERAEKFVQAEMAPFHKTVTDLKKRVKQGLREGTADRQQRRAEQDKAEHDSHGRLPRCPRSRSNHLYHSNQFKNIALAGIVNPAKSSDGEGAGMKLPLAGQFGPRLLSPGGTSRPGTQGPQSTYNKLHTRFKQLPAEVVEDNFTNTMHHLKGYFHSAHSTLQDQRPLLTKNFSRRELHHSTEDKMKRIAL